MEDMRKHLWLGYLGAGLILCLLYDLVPPVAGNGLIVPAVGISSGIAILVGARLNCSGKSPSNAQACTILPPFCWIQPSSIHS